MLDAFRTLEFGMVCPGCTARYSPLSSVATLNPVLVDILRGVCQFYPPEEFPSRTFDWAHHKIFVLNASV